ncbi:glycine cleavage system protein GcvH [Thermoanaerobacterium sp. DL9XJH110]|uniref:glycine cleavage system protein GcvH n=1 Tax=Thermoanaerobacterium sp. DL9XJH110 TaxID=3386643 RepID=UPI003BB4EA47
MSHVPENLKYTEEHEWILVEGRRGRIGITDHAQDALGDVVYVDLPEVGARVEKGEAFGAVESVKAASDIYAPVSGTVVEVNEALKDNPELVNKSPYDEGWMIVVEIDDESELDDLLSPADYEKLLERE